MNFKTKFTASLLFIFGLVFSVQAQTSDPVKDLRKSLVKNSRYQFQEVTLQFAAKDFKTCDVSYRFERTGSIGDENFGQATVERASTSQTVINTANAGRKTVEDGGGGQTRVITGNRPQYTLTQLTFFNNGYVTNFKLSDLNPDAVEVSKTPNGVYYLTLKTLDSKASIQKTPVGSGAVPVKMNSEILPVVSEKKAEKVKELFVRAIKQCAEQN